MTLEETEEIDDRRTLEFLSKKPPEATFLVEADVAFVGCDHKHEWKGPNPCEGQPHEDILCLVMNDTFAYACVDAENVADGDLATVASIYRWFGWVGLICWAARQRNEDPVIEFTEDPVYQDTWRALYGDLRVEANAFNKIDPRWCNDRLNLKPWIPLEED